MAKLRTSRSWAGILLAAALTLIAAAGPGRAEYRIAPGDVIEIAVAGQSELRQRAPVQMDGTIAVPIVGTLMVAGSTSSEVRTKVEAALGAKLLRQKTPDGRERIVLIQPGDVAAAVVEYRPVYVTGDVLNPGQHAYRPQMTARHAIALSGGPSTLRGRAMTAAAEVLDADQEYRTLAAALAKEHVYAWRLAAELDGEDNIKQRSLAHLPVPVASVVEFARVETQLLQNRLAEFKSEKTYLQGMVRQAGERITTLATQEQQEERGLQSDTEELERVTRLFSTGNLTSPRVSESRRAVLLSSTRRLQTSANLTQTKQQRDEYAWRLSSVEVRRRLEVLRAINESQPKLVELKLKFDAAGEKLRILGHITNLDPLGSPPPPGITLIRRSGASWERLSASDDVELQPGDTIELAFRAAQQSNSALQ